MQRTKRLVIGGLVIATLACGQVFGDDGLALMKVEHGARPAGMGAAFVSIVNDANSSVYNPAAISSIDGFVASFGHASYWENVRLESGSFALPLSGRTSLHGGIRFAVIDEIEQRMLPTSEPEAYFDAHDVSFKVGLSRRVSEKVTVGLSAGWFLEKIESWRGSAFNVDFGFLVQPKANINIGGSVTGLGSDFSLTKSGTIGSRDISLPTRYALGGSYTWGRYLGSADIVYLDDEARLHLGAEAQAHDLFKVRGGYMLNYDSKNITAGASFTKRNISVDYAFVPYTNDLGSTHLFNFTVRL